MADDAPLRRRPSDEVGELQKQLLRELQGILREGDSWSEPTLFRAYLQHAQALAWQRVADGDLNAPREILDHLLTALPFVDGHFQEARGLAAQAAQEVHQALRSLYLANQVLEEARTRARLADRDRSRTEREILRTLFENRATYLRRGAVRARMDPVSRPTPARVGQILVGLHHEGLIMRTHGRAQGNPSAAFYALSPRGFEVCRSLGLDDVRSKAVWIHRVIEKAVDRDTSPVQRKMLIDSLSTCSSPTVGNLVIETLEEGIRKEKDEASAQPYKEALLGVLLARRKIDFAAAPSSSTEREVSGSGPGLYILKSTHEDESGLLPENIVSAFITSLEKDMSHGLAQDGLIDVLLKERNRLSAERPPALATHA